MGEGISSIKIIFIETPGLHKGKSVLSKYMGKIAFDSIADSDIVALLIEAVLLTHSWSILTLEFYLMQLQKHDLLDQNV